MGADDPRGVQPVARGGQRRAVERVADDGESGGGEMAADLVRDAGIDRDVEQRKFVACRRRYDCTKSL